MNYPLISEYIEAIKSAEDSLKELSCLRPVLDHDGLPVMTSGNFAVVFKMKDKQSGDLYALKCFTKEQEGRAEAYREIAKELGTVSSPYLVSIRYLEKELFVDTDQTTETEFPVLLMDWVKGKTLDKYLHENFDNKYALEMLAYRFCKLAQWLIPQPFAHGDLKPDNILVRDDSTLALVDYDGMYVPAMKGQKARELGSPNFRHPLRTENDFDEHIDDFSLVAILLSLKAISLRPTLLKKYEVSNQLLFSENDYREISECGLLKELFPSNNSELNILVSLFVLGIEKYNLSDVSTELLTLSKPQVQMPEILSTEYTREDLANAWTDKYGVIYSSDRKRLLLASTELAEYTITAGTLGICDLAFQLMNLTSIHIPDNVKKIGRGAFSGCSFTSIHIPDSVTDIGDCAFSFNGSLTSISIPNSVIRIGHQVFWECRALNSILIPNSITSIGDGTFDGCVSLNSIHIPDSVTVIGEYAFNGCISLNSILISDRVTTIGDSAFKGCTALTSIHIPDSVTTIGFSAFEGCTSLSSIYIPNGVTSIGNSAFKGCVALASIHISDNNTILGHSAFKECKSLASILIPNNVTTIGNSAFEKCNSLTSIYIPDCVTSIGYSAFKECTALTSINIPDGITSIGDETFEFCNNLSFITIPDNITIIGNSAFCGCSSLTSIHIPDRIASIGESAFQGCESLTTIQVPDSVINIGRGAFSGCAALTSIRIPDSVTAIRDYAYSTQLTFQIISPVLEKELFLDATLSLPSKSPAVSLALDIALSHVAKP